MFEILFVFGALAAALVCIAIVAKLLLAVVLLPIKLGLFLAKGFLVLLCVVPAVLLSIGIASLVPLVVLVILGLPVLILVGGIVLLIKLLA